METKNLLLSSMGLPLEHSVEGALPNMYKNL